MGHLVGRRRGSRFAEVARFASVRPISFWHERCSVRRSHETSDEKGHDVSDQPTSTNPRPPSRPKVQLRDRRKPRIVIAEDDADMRALVAGALERDGYDVTAVSSGLQLLTHIETMLFGGWETGTFRLVICDDRLPGCRGLRILEGLRSMDPSTPIILMTGFGDDLVRNRCEELGGIFLDKPFDLDQLRATVRRLVPTREGSTEGPA